MKTIKFSISRGNIVLQAKDETYLSARSAIAVEVSNSDGRYEMQADERETHERKLLQSLSNAVHGLKSELNEYLISGSVDDAKDEVSFELSIHDSFDSSRADTLKTLFSNYISKRVISEWWKANYPSFAAQYDELTIQALLELKRAFHYKGEAKLKKFGE